MPAAAAVPTPAAWTSLATTNPVRDRWWSEFGPDIEALVGEALVRNHDLRAAAARLDAAEAQARIAGSNRLPRADLSFDAQRRQQNFVGLPIPGAGDRVLSSRASSFGVGLNTSWELDLWGRLRAGRSAAVADREAAEDDFRSAQHSLAAQTLKAWVATAELEQQLQLARSTAENYSATARQVRARYERGLRPPLDVRLALSAEATAKALVAQRERELQASRRQLELLIGRYPSGDPRGPGRLPALGTEVPAGLPSELLERRPDLRSAERRLAAANARVKEAKAALFPRISLTASGGRSSSELSDLLSNQFNVWALAANFVQPIFEGGRLRANVQLAEARAREATEAFAGAALRAFAEVESALAAEELLAAREANLAEAVLQSREALRLAEDRYRSGLENFVALLEAQRRVLEAESQWIAVQRQRLDNRLDLHLALGGGFTAASTPSASARLRP